LRGKKIGEKRKEIKIKKERKLEEGEEEDILKEETENHEKIRKKK
jgi:hypothetical protein